MKNVSEVIAWSFSLCYLLTIRDITLLTFDFSLTSDIESIKISDELVADIAPDGTVYGIELLNATEQLRRGDMGKFLVVNEATGQQVDVPLSTQ